jgi:hypothetical protein
VSRQPGPGDAEAIQQRIRQAREQLLGGRGPGASALETARWKTERPSLGGRDPAADREAVAERAAAIRGDPAALERLIARHSAQLAASLGEVTARVRRRARITVPATLAVTATVLALLQAAKLRRLPSSRGDLRSRQRMGTTGKGDSDRSQVIAPMARPTPSASGMCHSTVRVLMNSSAAISALVRPSRADLVRGRARC